MRESEIEKRFVRAVRELGGMAIKNAVSYRAGFPDRTVILRGGRTVYVEVKAPDGVLSHLQENMIFMLQNLGHNVEVIRSLDDIERFKVNYG